MIIIARPLHCTQASLNLQLLPGWAGWAACLPGSELLLQLKICFVQHATESADFFVSAHIYLCQRMYLICLAGSARATSSTLHLHLRFIFHLFYRNISCSFNTYILASCVPQELRIFGKLYFWGAVYISSKCSKKDDDGNGDLKPCAILIGSFQALPTRTLVLQFQLSDMIGARMMIHNHDDDDGYPAYSHHD